MTPLILTLVFDQLVKQSPFLLRPITGAVRSQVTKLYVGRLLDEHFTFFDKQLAASGGDYLLGQSLTIADVMMSFPAGMSI